MLNDEDILTLLSKYGGIYTDAQLSKMMEKYGIKISKDKIQRIRFKYRIYKLPLHLRPRFGGGKYKTCNGANKNNYNIDTVIETCKAILGYAIFSGQKVSNIYIRAAALRHYGITPGKAAHTFSFLRKHSIAKKVGKNGVWQINLRKLRKLMKKLENERNKN